MDTIEKIKHEIKMKGLNLWAVFLVGVKENNEIFKN